MPIRPIDRDALRAAVRAARPFPFFCIDGFLEEGFARECMNAFPSFEDATKLGQQFTKVNERKKVQITDSRAFPEPIARLHRELASPEFLATMSHVMDIPDLVADPELSGGGMHQTGPSGHLDVHVDFNYIPERKLFRRLNILLYFNEGWRPEWGGEVELWDPKVSVRAHAFAPLFNRCVVFETSDISFHGVTAVRCPPDVSRKSAAAYYYTRQPPKGWDGHHHSTIFKARPNERMKRYVLMPAERLVFQARAAIGQLKKQIRAMGGSS
jgi:Rps23 Pro-64 3,4-dihydroxylase Tpa1-like proline 4-hydroxylase